MGKKIIVVDDSSTVRLQVGSALKQSGFEIIEAVDGQDGFDKIQGNPEAALVICDVNMPRMNGLDMLEAVKKDGTRDNLPIIMLTTEGQPELIARAKKSGAKGWIVKPFKHALLVAAVEKLTA